MNTHCFSNCVPGHPAQPRGDDHRASEYAPLSFALSGVILASVIAGAVTAILCVAAI